VPRELRSMVLIPVAGRALSGEVQKAWILAEKRNECVARRSGQHNSHLRDQFEHVLPKKLEDERGHPHFVDRYGALQRPLSHVTIVMPCV